MTTSTTKSTTPNPVRATRWAAACALCLAACLIVPGQVAAQEGGVFLSVLPEVPLPPDLREHHKHAVIFDKPQGRIALTLASGTSDQESVLTFYDETLPALGWQRTAPGLYRRDGEALELKLESEGAQIIVRFLLSPDEG